MTLLSLRADAPVRCCTDVSPGDYVKVRGVWEPIAWNTAFGAASTPREWWVRTALGTHGMWDIDRYAKAEDFE